MDRYIIGDVKELPPLQQGSLDSLCGLYSIINAIRITAYPQKQIKMHQATLLMHDGLDFLESKASLNTVMHNGMSEALRLKLATHLIEQTHNHWGLRLYLTKAPKGHTNTMKFIISEIELGRLVCICVNGFYYHYTVICGYTKNQFKLYDSDGLQAIYKQSISIEGDHGRTRFKLLGKKMFSVGME